MQHAGGKFQRVDKGQFRFDFVEAAQEDSLRNLTRVVADLQRPDPWRQLQNGKLFGAEYLHQEMDPETQSKIEDILAIFEEDAVIAGLPPDCFGMMFFRGAAAEDRARSFQGSFVDGWERRSGQRANPLFLNCLHGDGLRVRDRHKANLIAGLDLSYFPQFGTRNGYRTDKAAEARSIAREDHGRVAGKVDAPEGVDAVMNVGGMQARFTSGIPRP